jgi:hypothetical protein
MVELFKIVEQDKGFYVKMLFFTSDIAHKRWIYEYIRDGRYYPETVGSIERVKF